MKVNEVITEAGLLGKIGRGLGSAAIAPIRALDILGGGSGNVGTKSQVAAREQSKITKANKLAVDKSYSHFAQMLSQQGINLNDPRTYTDSMKELLQAFVLHYYGSDWATGSTIQREINKIPVPTTINPGSIRQYLNQTGDVFVKVNNNMLAYKLAQTKEKEAEKEKASAEQPQSTTTQPDATQGPQLAPGVSVVNTDPVILRYGKKDYYIADDGMWHERNNRNPVDDAWQQFFDKQAELVEPQFQVSRQPPARPAPAFTKPKQTVAKPQPTPAEIRQQKQAAATQKIQQQMKPRIKLRSGETFDQAVARLRAGRQ